MQISNIPQFSNDIPKRGRGRPKGSKNKRNQLEGVTALVPQQNRPGQLDRVLAMAPQLDVALRLPAVCAIVGLSRAHVYNLMAADQFPKGIKLSARARGWRQSELQDWLAQRKAA